MAGGPGGAARQLAGFEQAGDLKAVARLQAGDPSPAGGREAPEKSLVGVGSPDGLMD